MISNFRRVLNVVFLLLGDSPASEFYVTTFRNIISSIFVGGVSSKNSSCIILPAYTIYEDGTDRVFRNVGI